MVSARPNFVSSANADIFAIAVALSIPLYGPEFTLTPYSVNASPAIARPDGLEFGSPSTFSFELSTSFGATTTRTGNPYFWQNSRSRWSCAGTAMIAPVPYSISTKFPTQIGVFSLLNGLIANRPVQKP